MNELYQSALYYAGLGFSVFPCKPKGKTPATEHGFKDGTTDSEQIRKWWSENPNYNIGIVTGQRSGIFVIDIDDDQIKGKAGSQILRNWEKTHGELPETVQALSGNGGVHLYYKYEPSLPVKSTQGIYKDIDIRGNGGYIIAPPSIHPSGNRYEWEVLHDIHDIKIADPNETVKTFLKKDIIPEGNRTNSLVSLAGRLIRSGLNDEAIKNAVRSENSNRCIPPLTEDELQKTVFPVLTRGYEASRETDLDRFHFIDKNGIPTSVYDYEIYMFLKGQGEMFVMGGIPYRYISGVYKQDINGAWLKSAIRKLIYPRFIRAPTIDRIYKLFLQDSDLQETSETINQFPAYWVNFRNGFYDPVQKIMIPHDHRYKAVNQIPHEYNPAIRKKSAVIDQWLDYIAEKPDEKEMLLQFCGYAMTRDTRQQKFLILFGTGGSGKSTLIRMIQAVIGSDNISNVSLKELNVRFASFGLVGKLLNSCADLEITALEDTSTIKKLLGEDAIRAEPKGKDSFSFYNYAKMLFSTNELPLIISEKTNGFYRRLMILKMDKQPPKADPNYLDPLMKDIDCFISECIAALERMYETGTITESQSSVEAVETLRNDSDTVQAWLNEWVTRDKNARSERSFLYENYERYCDISDRTKLSRNSFYRSLKAKNFKESKSGNYRYFEGISLEKTAL